MQMVYTSERIIIPKSEVDLTNTIATGYKQGVELNTRNVVEDEEAFAEPERISTMTTPVTVIGGEEIR